MRRDGCERRLSWRGDGKRAADARSRCSGFRQRSPTCGSLPRIAFRPPTTTTNRRNQCPSASTKRTTTTTPPRERKPRAARGGAKRRAKSRGRFRFGRLVYWGAVLGLWAAIAVVGVVVWVGAHLPAIQSLEIPKRPPTIQIIRRRRQRAGLARRNARRQCRAEGSAALSAEGVHRHRGPPLLFALRRRPRRHRARRRRQHPASRRLAGRLDADPAARQKPVPDPGTHDGAQAAGSGARAVAGAQAFQERNSRALPQPRLFRLRRLWRRGGGAALFRQIRQERHGRGSRDAGGPRQVAVAAGAEPQPRRRGSARPDRARGDGGRQIHHRRRRPRPRSDIPPTM